MLGPGRQKVNEPLPLPAVWTGVLAALLTVSVVATAGARPAPAKGKPTAAKMAPRPKAEVKGSRKAGKTAERKPDATRKTARAHEPAAKADKTPAKPKALHGSGAHHQDHDGRTLHGWARLLPLIQRVRVGDLKGLPAELEAVETSEKNKDVQLIAAYLQAKVRAGLGDGEGAARALERSKAIGELAPEAFRWVEIQVRVAQGKKAEALALLGELRKTWPDFRWAAADLLYSRLYETVGPAETAADVALQLYEKSQLHLPRDELLARAARVLQPRQPDKARALWKKLLMRHPESDLVDEAAKAVDPASLSDTEQFERMERLFARRAYERCRQLGLALWNKGFRKSEVGYYLGKIGSERLRDDYPGAARYLAAAIGENDPMASGSLLSYALVLAKLGRTDEAVQHFDLWLQRYPTAPEDKRVDVAYDRARALHAAGRSLQAAEDLAKVLDTGPRGIDHGKYWWFVGFWTYMGGDFAKAVDRMAPLLNNGNALVGGKSRYWTAKALDKLGKRKEAVEMAASVLRRHVLSYYSALAEDLLTEWGHAQLIPKRPDLSKVARRPHDPFAGLPHTADLRSLRLAVSLGEPDVAGRVFDDLRPALTRKLGKDRVARLEEDLADPLERFAEARQRAVGRYRKSLKSEPTAATVEHWRAVYPRAYATHAVYAAERYGAPEWMVYAHMLQESRYKPWLISGAPAYGLLELLDRTAVRLAREAGEDYQLWMLMVPAHNVRWGAQYLGALYKKFHQQLPFAIGSYNGGPMLFEYHLKVAGQMGRALDEMIDDLGPHESRNYVRMVIGHFLRYLAIYETPKRAAELRAQLFPKPWRVAWLPHPDY